MGKKYDESKLLLHHVDEAIANLHDIVSMCEGARLRNAIDVDVFNTNVHLTRARTSIENLMGTLYDEETFIGQ